MPSGGGTEGVPGLKSPAQSLKLVTIGSPRSIAQEFSAPAPLKSRPAFDSGSP